MASDHVIRIPRGDSDGEYVIVNVSSNGPSSLDLKLIATEGESPFILTLKQSRISKLRAKSSTLNEGQWEVVLESILLQKRVSEEAVDVLSNLEVVANITEEQLFIVFRKNISGIHQRLGEIALHKDEDQEIDTLAWVATAVTRGNTLASEIVDLQKKYSGQGETVKKLNSQLEDLVKAKKDHEDALLEKFRELLNMKKLKIRDQQRLLAGAKVDPLSPAQVKAARPSTSSPAHKPSSSRATKRKPKASPSEPASATDSDDTGFEKMDGPRVATPDKSNLDATEDEEDDLDAPPPVSQSLKSTVDYKKDIMEAAKRSESPPPRRQLPFGQIGSHQNATESPMKKESSKISARDTKALGANEIDDDETTSDDEL